MQAFFTAQMDFVFFVYGLSFFLLAVTAYFIYQIKPNQYFWKWIALFGVLHGITEWLDMIALNFAQDMPLFTMVRVAFLMASFVCFVEIARQKAQEKHKNIVSLWIYIPLLLGVAGVGWKADGLIGINVLARYVFGVCGGLAAARVIYQMSRKEPELDKSISPIAILLAIYVTTQFFAPLSRIFPSSFINQTTFFTLTGIPIQVVRVFLAGGMAFLVWKYYLQQRMKIVAGRGKGYGVRMGVIFPVSLAILLIMGWVGVEMVGQRRMDEKKRILYALAENEAGVWTADDVVTLRGVAQDLQSAVYQEFSQETMGIFIRYPEALSVYLFGQKDGQHIFLFDSASPLYKEKDGVPLAEPGEVYPQDVDLLAQMFRDGGIVVVGPEKDKWGNFMSALAAIRSPQTGQVVAVLGIDYGAEQWLQDIAQYRLAVIIIVFLFILGFVVFFVIYKHEKEIQQDLKLREQKLLDLSGLLEKERASLETIFNSTQVGLILVDSKRQVKRVNEVIGDFVGKDTRAIIGHRPGEGLNCVHLKNDALVCGQAPACALCPLANTVKSILRNGDTVRGLTVQHRFHRVSGEVGILRLEVNASPLELQGERHVLLSIENVTERWNAEKALEEYRSHLEDLVNTRTKELGSTNKQLKAEILEHEAANIKLKEANELKSQFLFNVSHEIRTPLNGIIGFAELIAQSQDLKRTSMMARTILQEADILLTLVNDVLDQAMIESGKVAIECAPVDMKEVLSPLMKTMTVFSNKKGLEFRLEGADDVPQFIMSDRLRLGQILMNLTNNAFKFTEEGRVTLRMEVVNRDQDKVVVRFSVIDTGMGIPKERQHLVFERFAQVDGASTRKHGGAGLGSSIAKGLVELMGGTIGFTSQEGVGSAFWFELPFKECQDPGGILAVEKDPRGAKGVMPAVRGPILAVEDYEVNQDVIRMNLDRGGYQGEIVASGIAAIKACGAKEYKLILMDIQMPDMDGFETAQKIRAIGGWAVTVPIIGVTANVDEHTRRRCFEVGMQDVMAKPLRYQRFMAMIARWLGEGAAVDVPGQPDDTGVDSVLNYEQVVQEFAGNKALLDGVMMRFLEQVKRQINFLAQAIVSRDGAVIGREAHKIKGAAANLTAMRVSSCAKLMEEKGKAGELDGMEALLEELKKQVVGLEASFMEQKD